MRLRIAYTIHICDVNTNGFRNNLKRHFIMAAVALFSVDCHRFKFICRPYSLNAEGVREDGEIG